MRHDSSMAYGKARQASTALDLQPSLRGSTDGAWNGLDTVDVVRFAAVLHVLTLPLSLLCVHRQCTISFDSLRGHIASLLFIILGLVFTRFLDERKRHDERFPYSFDHKRTS